MRWIAQLLHGLGFHGKSLELPCLVRVHDGDVRMDLLEYPLPCGHSGYRIDLEYHAAKLDRWVEIASLRDFNLDEALALLTEAKRCIDNLRKQA